MDKHLQEKICKYTIVEVVKEFVNILRGSLDFSEYRQPVMTLLLVKRLNDTFEENAENLINKGINKKEAYNKRRQYGPRFKRRYQIGPKGI